MTSPSEDYNLDVINGVFCMDCGMDFDEFGNCDCSFTDCEDDSWDDADSLIGIGWGTDEDYGYYGD